MPETLKRSRRGVASLSMKSISTLSPGRSFSFRATLREISRSFVRTVSPTRGSSPSISVSSRKWVSYSGPIPFSATPCMPSPVRTMPPLTA